MLPDFTKKNLEICPLERAETIPSSWYVDPHFLKLDKQCIFARTWQYVGHRSRVEHPGNYLTATIAGNPIIIVRGKDNIVRAFYNVCRHRGGPLAIDESGNCNVLQCKYHGWTYALDGMLRGVPQFDRVELFDRKDFGLIPVNIDTWEGLVFVKLSKDETSLSSTMKGIPERIAPIKLSTKKFHRRVNYDVNCNWKVYVDNYLEGYHLPYVHPELCQLLDYQKYVTETFEHYSLQYSPFTGNENVYGSRDGVAYYYFVFPNFMMNILPGRLQTNLVIPLSHNRCRVIFDYYYDDIVSADARLRADQSAEVSTKTETHSGVQVRKFIEDDIEYSDTIQQEDMEICEHVQRGLESVAYDKGRFSVEMEKGVYHFQCLLKKAYQQAYNSLL
ncbi:MAG: aromatic ring-hydroxylating dioxygenase subunit alpha [Ignavibacteriae bacterium]|nr:aromatic ring-hydroxylating dioxygenase subunit alpha [Ignavibacteriota bacterium]